MTFRRPMLLAVALPFALAACSSGPSESDAEFAIARLIEQSGAGEVVEVQNFALSGCVEAEQAAGYRCDTQAQVVIRVMGHQTTLPVSGNLRYSEADGQWRAYV